jgi:Cu/Zn superoxide dismutase
MSTRSFLARALTGGVLALLAVPAVAGAQSASRPVVVAHGSLVDLSAATVDPTDGASAYLVSAVAGSGTRLTFVVTGIEAPVGRVFGVHAHVGPCTANAPAAAGPHYRVPGGPVDPHHEVWLDFAVRPGGYGVATTVVPFVIPDGAARSVVIHQAPTAPDGSAGPRLACLPVAF